PGRTSGGNRIEYIIEARRIRIAKVRARRGGGGTSLHRLDNVVDTSPGGTTSLGHRLPSSHISALSEWMKTTKARQQQQFSLGSHPAHGVRTPAAQKLTLVPVQITLRCSTLERALGDKGEHKKIRQRESKEKLGEKKDNEGERECNSIQTSVNALLHLHTAVQTTNKTKHESGAPRAIKHREESERA
ncbi:hypothetical protein FOCC_FOCC017476, partial [Frankliniella occidentalis]